MIFFQLLMLDLRFYKDFEDVAKDKKRGFPCIKAVSCQPSRNVLPCGCF